MPISESGSEDFLAAFFVENLLKYEQICGIINVAGILPHDGSCFCFFLSGKAACCLIISPP